ncbi:hypothetical protein H6G76_35015 [Nostoc sp. FACHB-152]|uniref:hypothetical protein n=1 Tax=unclassified Nostoc TaxID=2593658 RepID=UPI00168515A7|nr:MULTISPECIES: hypothetical protein [unclassified Nostoc]MBD2452222.1 hypothetical protein [Nostoc sp. FACHB-152]MBD2470993.1 hypothetical protein [Nostoc sp. FACHB-145]
MTNNKILICTLLALSSGFFGSYIGGQITLMLHSQKCQNQPWGLNQMCHAWVAPGAMWQGSTRGLLTGTVLGAFVGGIITRQP